MPVFLKTVSAQMSLKTEGSGSSRTLYVVLGLALFVMNKYRERKWHIPGWIKKYK